MGIIYEVKVDVNIIALKLIFSGKYNLFIK